jgi:hypothetical protein
LIRLAKTPFKERENIHIMSYSQRRRERMHAFAMGLLDDPATCSVARYLDKHLIGVIGAIVYACVPTVYPDGCTRWHDPDNPDVIHREGDKPAIVYADGTRLWYKDGKLHRKGNRPAVVGADGGQLWYYMGNLYREGDGPVLQDWWIK